MATFASLRTLDDDIAADQKGSQVAVEQPRMDFIGWTAGDGHFRTFAPANRAPQNRQTPEIDGSLPFGWVIGGNCPCYKTAYFRLITC